MIISHIEPIDDGQPQERVAGEVLRMVHGQEFGARQDFNQIERQLVTVARDNLGLDSAPPTCELVAYWRDELPYV